MTAEHLGLGRDDVLPFAMSGEVSPDGWVVVTTHYMHGTPAEHALLGTLLEEAGNGTAYTDGTQALARAARLSRRGVVQAARSLSVPDGDRPPLVTMVRGARGRRCYAAVVPHDGPLYPLGMRAMVAIARLGGVDL